MLNLVGNALKFTPKGSITVTVVADGGGQCELIVKDSGIGIPPERVDSVFEKFEQAETSTTRQFGGTGLGSTFSVRIPLPAIKSKVTEESNTTPIDTDFSIYKVLLVDDNAINRIVAAKFCQSLNIEVESCANGASVWRCLTRKNIT